MNAEEILNDLTEIIVGYGPRLVGAILVWFVGRLLIRIMNRIINSQLERRQIDVSLKPFVKTVINTTFQILLIISVLSTMGIEMTSFVAILGAAGLAIGMALSGTLQNFAGGVIILLLKPFKADDLVEAQGYIGKVKEIQIFNTVLVTPDNKTVIIPNGGLATGSLINYTGQATRRVDFTFGIGYGDSTEEARKVLMNLIDQDERILKDPEPLVEVGGLGSSSVDMTVRVWTNTDDYWPVFYTMNDKVYNEFNKVGLNIPYPQMDVHLHKEN